MRKSESGGTKNKKGAKHPDAHGAPSTVRDDSRWSAKGSEESMVGETTERERRRTVADFSLAKKNREASWQGGTENCRGAGSAGQERPTSVLPRC